MSVRQSWFPPQLISCTQHRWLKKKQGRNRKRMGGRSGEIKGKKNLKYLQACVCGFDNLITWWWKPCSSSPDPRLSVSNIVILEGGQAAAVSWLLWPDCRGLTVVAYVCSSKANNIPCLLDAGLVVTGRAELCLWPCSWVRDRGRARKIPRIETHHLPKEDP